MAERPTPGMAEALESAFAKARTEREAKEAAQFAADSVPTDNIAVLRERATRHATQAVDEYWGDFGDMQLTLNQRVITPLLNTVTRIAAERDKARAVALNEAAAEVVASCPDHGPRDEAWMDCHCAVTDELRRMAAPAPPVPDNTTGDELERLRAELAAYKDELDSLHRNTLPQLRREIQHHQDGKKRWGDRAVKAETERDELKKRLGRATSLHTHSGSKPYHKGWNDAVAAVLDAANADPKAGA